MKTVNKRKATGVLGRMITEVDPVKLAKTRNRMIVAAKIADAMKAKYEPASIMANEPMEDPMP